MHAMMMPLILLFMVLTSGCATLAKTETFAACQAADAVTTVAVLGKGGAEANPLMATIIAKYGYFGMFAVKAALVGLVYQALRHNPDSNAVRTTVAVGSAITCGVAAHNVGVLNSMTRDLVK